MNSFARRIFPGKHGFALVVVLALLVLLAGLTLAYFSRVAGDRQVAHSSFNQSKADQLAASAMESIIGDLRQEIFNGSSPTPTPNPTPVGFVLVPSPSPNILPARSPVPAPASTPAIQNLIRRSVRSDSIQVPALASRASAVNSTTDVSANGRSISLARWNSHYLIPKANRGDDKSDPVTTGFTAPRYWAPDWVFVTNQGANVITAPSNAVIGRYAYAIYDEGGLIDVNVAGYPTGTSIYQYGRKGSLAFADLTAPSPYSIPNPDAGGTYQVDRLVGWRNYGTVQPTNNFPDSNPASQAFARNFQTSTAPAAYFYNFVVNNASGFLTVRSDPTPTPTPYPWNYLNVTGDPTPSPYPWNGRSDQTFLGRQQLLAFRTTTQFSSSALEYLGTFSREAVAGSPQWSPATPTATNPNFQTLLATSSFVRNDGTTANVGDPLVNKRFLLQRLNWLTYKGPSALRTIPTSAPAVGSVNYDMWLLTSRFGLTSTFLQQGTAANILKYFGLAWDSTTNATTGDGWVYVGHGGGSSPLSSIATLGSFTGTREPDFFELLQAGILDGSVGDSYSPDSVTIPTNQPTTHQQSKMLHILTIGANLIAQSRADSYPVRIACSVNVNGTSTTMEALGCPRLPYLNSLAACPVAGTGTTGGINWFLVPNLWDPFRDTWDIKETTVSSTLTPGYLRPPVRITVSGNVGFGAIANSASLRSGCVPTVTAFPTTVSGINSSLTLKTGGGAAFGRDEHDEGSRLAAPDFTTPPATYVTTTSPTSAAGQWNSISAPMRPGGGADPTADNYVAFTLTLPGSSIPSGVTSPAQNPVLILKPLGSSIFQMTMDYQSPNGTWYPYSFLQGNNATNTWIGAGSSTNQGLNLVTIFSQYGVSPPATNPTVVKLGTATTTPWDVSTLAQAPMFAKADPRSIRYNSQIGVVNVSKPPMAVVSSGIARTICPNPYSATAPPLMTTASTPAPTPTPIPTPTPSPTPTPTPTPAPNPNPAFWSQSGDNGPAGSNPYDESVSAGQGDVVRPVVMNRPFRSVGEMGYAFRDQPFRTLSFSSANSPDAGLLDLFSVSDYSDPSSMRAGIINLNSHEATALAAVLGSTIKREDTPRGGSPPAPTPLPLTTTEANSIAASLASNITPVTNKAGIATLIANETGLGPGAPKTQRESIVRALGEAGQTRTWNLFIDVIAQSGNYPPGENNIANFVVQGEQRYWVHVAIDRFTGQVIDKQIEVVNE
jgi:hypothetical protein